MNQSAKARRARARSGVGTGTTSLLMIFTVLCFATLAMLSLSTAASNDRIQERGLSGSKALAEARGAAAVEVAGLDEALLELQRQANEAVGASAGGNASAETLYFEEALALAATRGWEADAEGNTVTLRRDVNEESVLVTQLQILPPGGDARYEVVRQVSELTNGWTPEEGGRLWQPTPQA